MNYRHAFHAGNFADVVKHVILTRIIDYLRRKDAPFRVIDTHAGIGLYDLDGPQSARTGEWQEGVGRLADPFDADVERLLEPYRDVLARARDRHGPSFYPGSPAVIREMLRPQDRAIAVEKHPEDCATLQARFITATRLKVLHLDGWTALNSLLPPKERRGLVLIDPPYEERDELERAASAVAQAWSKWRSGVFALWYPIKDKAATNRFAEDLARSIQTDTLRLELLIDEPDGSPRLIGCGLVVVNPPYTLASEAVTLLPALAERFSSNGRGSFRVDLRDARQALDERSVRSR